VTARASSLRQLPDESRALANGCGRQKPALILDVGKSCFLWGLCDSLLSREDADLATFRQKRQSPLQHNEEPVRESD
jgi:hypothetical protein